MINFDVYKDGKRNIITMSYDDGSDHDRRLVEIFNKYGIRGTFHLNSGKFGNPGYINADEVSSLYEGHEISCHTVNHGWLEKMPVESVINEVMQDRKNLESLCGYPVRGMSYPFGTYNDNVIAAVKQCGIKYSRTVTSTHSFGLPNDFLQWPATCHHNAAVKLADEFISKLNNPWFSGLFYIWGHSFEFDRQNNWEMIDQLCKKLSGRDDVWYATNIEIYDYITAQRQLQISADETIIYNPTATTVWFRKDGKMYKINGGEKLIIN